MSGEQAAGERRSTGLDDPRAVDILTTEHWSLLSTRTLGYQEMFGRATIFTASATVTATSIAASAIATATTVAAATIAAGLVWTGLICASLIWAGCTSLLRLVVCRCDGGGVARGYWGCGCVGVVRA